MIEPDPAYSSPLASSPADLEQFRREGLLSFNQEKRLLFEELAKLHSVSYLPFVIPFVLQLSGKIKIYALRKALDQLISRQPVLRTAFLPSPHISSDVRLARLNLFARNATILPGLYYQAVRQNVRVRLRVEPLPRAKRSSAYAAIARIVNAELASEFDYARPPLLRATLLHGSGTTHFLILTIHHLIADRTSLAILKADLQALYNSCTGHGLPPGPLRSTYIDFAARQHAQLESDGFRKALDYWKEQLDLLRRAQLMNRDLPPGMRRRGQAIQALSIGRETAKRLRVFARKNRITLYMLFLAALTLVLQRLTNKTAAVVWGNFQNRNPQISDLMGWCANTLPLAIDVGNDRVLSNVLDQVRLAVLRGLEHQHVPLASLWPALGGPKLFDDLTILFDVIGDDREEEATPAFAGHLGFRSVEIPGVFLRSHVSLALCVTISGVDLRMEVTYATETFSTQTVRWILRNMIGILQRMTEDASAPLSSIVRPRVRKKNARADCELPQQQTTYGSWQLLHQTDWGS